MNLEAVHILEDVALSNGRDSAFQDLLEWAQHLDEFEGSRQQAEAIRNAIERVTNGWECTPPQHQSPSCLAHRPNPKH